MRLFAGLMLLLLIMILGGCHGGTLDAVYPGGLGHGTPPAIDLPPQDAGMEYR